MPLAFTHTTAAQRVHFGPGTAADAVLSEVQRLGAERVMLVAGGHSSNDAERIGRALPVVSRWSDTAQHVPVEIAVRARSAAVATSADVIVCVGGGSTVGMAKAVALTQRLPIVAVPTTFAGSEATDVWGLTENGRKSTGIDPAVLPIAVVYDVELTSGLDAGIAVASVLNGIAHCVDGFWAPRADPINAALGAEGLRSLAAGVRAIASDPADIAGRETAQYGAYLAAVAFSSAGSGLHHKICHTLGGTLGLPHAQTHAIVLRYVAAVNLPAAPDAARRICVALDVQGAPDARAALDALNALYIEVDAPRALRELGMREQDIAPMVDIIEPLVPASNPVSVDASTLTRLLSAAWAGETPA